MVYILIVNCLTEVEKIKLFGLNNSMNTYMINNKIYFILAIEISTSIYDVTVKKALPRYQVKKLLCTRNKILEHGYKDSDVP